MVVVLPVPFTPTTKMTRGRVVAAAPFDFAGTAFRMPSSCFLSAARNWPASCRGSWSACLANRFDHLFCGAHAQVGGEQGIFKAPELLRVEPPVARKDALDARSNFRARLVDGLFEALKKRRRRCIVSEKGNHRPLDCLDAILAEGHGWR